MNKAYEYAKKSIRAKEVPKYVKKQCREFVRIADGKDDKYFLDDKHPDALATCEELLPIDEGVDTLNFSSKVYCQSYSSSFKHARNCFILAIPMQLTKRFEKLENDGLVSVESAKFANYRGEALDSSVSHSQIIDLFPRGSQREQIYAFYKSICNELADMGF